jgi:hypothetical protein
VNRAFGAVGNVAHGGDDAAVVVRCALPFGAGDQLLRVVAQYGFQQVLGQVAKRGRGDVVERFDLLLPFVFEAAEFLTGERGDPAGPAIGGRTARREEAVHVDARSAQYLERAGVHHVCGRCFLHLVAPLDEHVIDALLLQQHRSQQADGACTHHQHGGLIGNRFEAHQIRPS